MKYIVMDLEFNQPFDFPEGDKAEPDPKCPAEIIQIGLVKLDENMIIQDTARFYVKPQIYKRIHPFVGKITGIEYRQLEEAPFFTKAYPQMIDFIGEGKAVFCTWGGDDVKELYRNVLYHGLNNKLLTRDYINVQKLAGVKLGSGGNCVGLKAAVEAFGLEAELEFHDALNDAVYTARIFNIVHSENTQVDTFNLSNLKNSIKARDAAVNAKLLFNFAESKFGRKLTQKEKGAALKIYNAGRLKRFDLSKG